MTLDFGEHMRISQQQRLLCACAWTKNCFLVWMTWKKKKKKTLKNYTICPKSQCCVIMVNNHAWICKKESISKKIVLSIRTNGITFAKDDKLLLSPEHGNFLKQKKNIRKLRAMLINDSFFIFRISFFFYTTI